MASMNNTRNSFRIVWPKSGHAWRVRILEVRDSHHLLAGEEYLMVKAQELSPSREFLGQKVLLTRPGECRPCYVSAPIIRMNADPFVRHAFNVETFSSSFTIQVVWDAEETHPLFE